MYSAIMRIKSAQAIKKLGVAEKAINAQITADTKSFLASLPKDIQIAILDMMPKHDRLCASYPAVMSGFYNRVFSAISAKYSDVLREIPERANAEKYKIFSGFAESLSMIQQKNHFSRFFNMGGLIRDINGKYISVNKPELVKEFFYDVFRKYPEMILLLESPDVLLTDKNGNLDYKNPLLSLVNDFNQAKFDAVLAKATSKAFKLGYNLAKASQAKPAKPAQIDAEKLARFIVSCDVAQVKPVKPKDTYNNGLLQREIKPAKPAQIDGEKIAGLILDDLTREYWADYDLM
jgi:hypothetical protein